MKIWPPRLPKPERTVDAFGALLENTRGILASSEVDRYREIAEIMKAINTSARIIVSDEPEFEGELVVSLEVELPSKKRSMRVKTPGGKTTRLTPLPELELLPTPVVHAATNAVSKVRAATLANMLAHDFYVFGEEEHQYAEIAGAEGEELDELDPHRHTEELKKLYEKIRGRDLRVL